MPPVRNDDPEPKESDFQTFYSGPCLECIATDLDQTSTLLFRVKAVSGEHHSQWSLPLHVIMEDNRFAKLPTNLNMESLDHSGQQILNVPMLPADLSMLEALRPQETPCASIKNSSIPSDTSDSSAACIPRTSLSHGLC